MSSESAPLLLHPQPAVVPAAPACRARIPGLKTVDEKAKTTTKR